MEENNKSTKDVVLEEFKALDEEGKWDKAVGIMVHQGLILNTLLKYSPQAELDVLRLALNNR